MAEIRGKDDQLYAVHSLPRREGSDATKAQTGGAKLGARARLSCRATSARTGMPQTSDVEIEIRLAVKRQNPFRFSGTRFQLGLPFRPSSSPLKLSFSYFHFERRIVRSPIPRICGLPPCDLLGYGSQYHVLHLHCSLPLQRQSSLSSLQFLEICLQNV